jgi:quercetin 2,3-dioxygenase
MKRVLNIAKAPGRHWVGDGFPVHGMFGYDQGAAQRSPFLMMDYAAPTEFTPNTGKPRGVGAHPHRGFETVTIVYAGEVAHRDSAGGGGVIGPGDVQWMTAGSGIVHDEFHSTAYSLSGGPFQMVQLWVNLPARDKMTAPGYQAIADADIPPVPLAGGAGQARLIAGQWGGARGPAHTFTPMNVWDVSLNAGHTAELPQPEGWTTLLMVLGGTVQVNGQTPVGTAQLVTLSREGSDIQLAAPQGNARVLLLSGEPIDEPVVGYGPFVMNTQQEIVQAFNDYNSGQFGQVAATAN